MAIVVDIPLRYWPDPQGDSVLVYSERECSVYRGCWTDAGDPADFIARLDFGHVGAVRSFPREFHPYMAKRDPAAPPEVSGHVGFVLAVSDSDFLREHLEYRKRVYPTSPPDSGMRHFVIAGHDFFHEILADGFSETMVPGVDLKEPRLRALLATA